MNRRIFRPVATGAATLALVGLGATAAHATNQGSTSGDHSTACAVDWSARTVMDIDLNNTQDGGGLAVNLAGQPVDYSNGGYIEEVRPEYGGSGIMEITHWYQTDTTGVYRIPVATDHTITDAQVTVTLPANSLDVTFDNQSTNATMLRWGGVYANYTWAPAATLVSSDATTNTYVVDLGTLQAGTGTVFQFNFDVAPGTDLTVPQYSSAHLTGGTTTCPPVTPPTTPPVTPPVTPPTTPTTPTTPVTPTKPVTPSTPVTPTKPVAPSKPAPVRTTTAYVQIDQYAWGTAADKRPSAWFGNRIAAFDDDGVLRYREDGFIWQSAAARRYTSSTPRIIAVQVPVGATHAQLVTAVNAAAARAGLPTITTTARLGAVGASGRVTDFWLLGAGATPAQPWGAKHTVNQAFIGRR